MRPRHPFPPPSPLRWVQPPGLPLPWGTFFSRPAPADPVVPTQPMKASAPISSVPEALPVQPPAPAGFRTPVVPTPPATPTPVRPPVSPAPPAPVVADVAMAQTQPISTGTAAPARAVTRTPPPLQRGDIVFMVPIRRIDGIYPVGNLDLEPLVRSIALFGVLQPLIIRNVEGRFELVAGAHRLAAAMAAGLTEVPCFIVKADDERARELAEAVAIEGTRPEPRGTARRTSPGRRGSLPASRRTTPRSGSSRTRGIVACSGVPRDGPLGDHRAPRGYHVLSESVRRTGTPVARADCDGPDSGGGAASRVAHAEYRGPCRRSAPSGGAGRARSVGGHASWPR